MGHIPCTLPLTLTTQEKPRGRSGVPNPSQAALPCDKCMTMMTPAFSVTWKPSLRQEVPRAPAAAMV